MRFGLCVLVRNEATRLANCLEPALEFAAEVVVLDNDSSDGTSDLLRSRYGIDPIPVKLSEERCYSCSEPRNLGFDLLSTPWILCLDADESMDREVLMRIAAMSEEPGVSGYFGRWLNQLEGSEPFDDYKLFLFRHGFHKRGLVHDNVQIDIREKGGRARWLDWLTVLHRPSPKRVAWKKVFYRQRLRCAIRREPDWFRYNWFLGYSLFQDGEVAEAEPYLRIAAESRSLKFPVECLNSAMVLTELLASQGRVAEAGRILDDARSFFESVRSDFEVVVNFRMSSWLEGAAVAARSGRPETIHAYRFAR
jgi:glycosyltransferase involved in cell wall biosynthesis